MLVYEANCQPRERLSRLTLKSRDTQTQLRMEIRVRVQTRVSLTELLGNQTETVLTDRLIVSQLRTFFEFSFHRRLHTSSLKSAEESKNSKPQRHGTQTSQMLSLLQEQSKPHHSPLSTTLNSVTDTPDSHILSHDSTVVYLTQRSESSTWAESVRTWMSFQHACTWCPMSTNNSAQRRSRLLEFAQISTKPISYQRVLCFADEA